MRSGTKNCYVDIQRATEGADANTNAPIYTWSTWKNAWANAIPRRGREQVIDGQVVAQSYMRFEFDYLDVNGIRETDVIVFDGVRFAIAGLLPDISTKDVYVVDAVAQAAGTDR